MKIVADENIPYAKELFSPLGDVTYKAGRHLSSIDIQGADALLVRSVTPVNQALLNGSDVKFVGTCTIGTDHLDTRYLASGAIGYASAPGCNAYAVVQYVVSVLATLNKLDTRQKVVVVGGGNVGSRVYRGLTALGFDCRVVDPFLDASCGMPLDSFEAIYRADIVCAHTPFTTDGEHPTKHMFGESELKKLKNGALLINAGRGGVIDNLALKHVLAERAESLDVVLDVWEREPDIDAQLLDSVHIGSPHIAGYSLEGRVQGSLMVFDALCQHFDIDPALAKRTRDGVVAQAFGEPQRIAYSSLREMILSIYDPRKDFARLVAEREALPSVFDVQRKNYPKRREFSHFHCEGAPDKQHDTLRALGFIIEG